MKTQTKKMIKGTIINIAVPVIVYAIFAIICLCAKLDSFFSTENVTDFLYRICYSTLLALGIVIPLLCGRFDYAAGTIPSLSSYIVLNIVLRHWQMNPWLILFFTIICSILITLISYGVYIFCRIPTQICSLGIVMITEAISTFLNGINFESLQMDKTSNYFLYEIRMLSRAPYNIIILAVSLVVIWVLLYRTKFGKDIFSLSANTKLAINNGVNQIKNLLCCAVLCGVIFGIAGTWKVLSNQIVTQDYPAKELASVFVAFGALGGVMVGRYLGKLSNNLVLGILCGTIAMTTITVFINVISSYIPGTTSIIVNGLIIVLFALYQSNDQKVFWFFKSINNKIKGLFTKKKEA